MNAVELVVRVLWVELAALASALACIFGYAVLSRRADERRRARMSPARALIARHLEDHALSEREMTELRALSASEGIRLFFDVAPSVGRVEREWLRQVAVDLGLVQVALGRIASQRWWRRLSGARFLSLIGAEPVVMERLSADPDPAVRAASATFLAHYPTPSGVDALVDMLGDPSAVSRFAARDALMRLGATATPVIVSRLAQVDERRAISLLEVACAAPSHEYITAAEARFDDERPTVRRLVARLLRGMGGAFASKRLVVMLRDDADSVREAAVEALGFLNHWPASPSVAALLDDPSSRVRLAAALALGRFGPPGELFLRRAITRGSDVAVTAARRILEDPSRLDASDALHLGRP